MWYRAGTVAVTNGSTTVTGTGTNWIAGVGVGEAFYGPDERIYEIASVVSATQLTLGSAYLGTTQTGQAYVILPSQSYIRDLAAQAAQLVSDYAGFASNAGSGKFGDGTVTSPGVRFTSDENTGIRRAGIDDMRLVANGADQATINASGLSVADDRLRITGSADATKVAQFEVDGFTTATTRTFTLPNASTTVVGTDATQTLTNKTINLTSNTLVATSAQLASAITDETGSGALVFGTDPTLTNPVISGGTINNTVIGGTTRAAGNFTTLNTTGNVTLGDANTDIHTINGVLNQPVGAGVGLTTGGNLTVRSPDGVEGGQISLYNKANTVTTLNIDVDTSDQCRIFTTQNNTSFTIGQIGGATGGSVVIHTGSNERIGISSAGVTTITGNAVVNSNSSTDALRITQNGSGNALVVEDAANPDSTPFVIDASGNVYVGRASPVLSGKLEIQNDAVNAHVVSVAVSDTIRPTSVNLRYRAGALAVQNNDQLGVTQFRGFDGAGAIIAAQISADVDGTPGTNDMPGRLVFSTTADGASSPTERMRLTNSGNLGIGMTPFYRLDVTGTSRFIEAFGSAGVANVRVNAFGTAQGQKAGIAFYTTFEGSADNGPRRSADIWSGFSGGTWTKEYLAFGVGLGASNDAGNVTTERMRIDGSGNILAVSATGGLGYGAGAGGTVTQATSRTTAVTLNKPTGRIDLVSAAGSASWANFVVNNSVVSATDTVVVSAKTGSTNVYLCHATVVANGSFQIAFATTGGTATDTVSINFAIIKGAAT